MNNSNFGFNKNHGIGNGAFGFQNTQSGYIPPYYDQLVGWYRSGIGITLNTGRVSSWANSAPSGVDKLPDATQGALAQMPTYLDGTLIFNRTEQNFLEIGTFDFLNWTMIVSVKPYDTTYEALLVSGSYPNSSASLYLNGFGAGDIFTLYADNTASVRYE